MEPSRPEDRNQPQRRGERLQFTSALYLDIRKMQVTSRQKELDIIWAVSCFGRNWLLLITPISYFER
jgi:hypothetical protein